MGEKDKKNVSKKGTSKKNESKNSISKQNTSQKGMSFDAYYAEAFGSRWASLKEALLMPPLQVPFTQSLMKPYYMDVASVAVSSSMPTLDDGLILDMCAAPGGKTLVLASMMEKSVALQANELSSNRRARLHRVIQEHLSEEVRNRIEVTGYNASVMARFCKEKYDRILLDAPCSSERHVIASESAIKQWTPARIKTLSIRQWALLSAAFLMLKAEGFLIYSTCALLEAENDCIIDKLLKKYKGARVVNLEEEFTLPLRFPIKTRHGYAYLPDLHSGAGPMYFSLLSKIG